LHATAPVVLDPLETCRMTARRVIPLLLLLMSFLIAACVPETDLERVGSTSNNDNSELTPISDEDLPEIEDLELRLLSIDTHRRGGRVAVEIAIGAGSDDEIRLADTARVEWSDGEITDALPLPGANILIESVRSDPDEVLVPVRVYLSSVTRHVGTDHEAEVTSEEIITRWGTFPVLDIDLNRRPPGWKLEFQAAGHRWVSEARLRQEDGRIRTGEGDDLVFNEDFVPITAALQFGLEIEDLEEALPLPAEIDVRQAIPEMMLEL
jgi:hypothetical protein